MVMSGNVCPKMYQTRVLGNPVPRKLIYTFEDDDGHHERFSWLSIFFEVQIGWANPVFPNSTPLNQPT